MIQNLGYIASLLLMHLEGLAVLEFFLSVGKRKDLPGEVVCLRELRVGGNYDDLQFHPTNIVKDLVISCFRKIHMRDCF